MVGLAWAVTRESNESAASSDAAGMVTNDVD
jgi:hypothetical protein